MSETKQKKRSFKIINVVDGSVLANKTATKYIYFTLYLSFLAIIYIGNRYSGESLLRKTKQLQDNIKELKSESISTASDLMNYTKQSVVILELNKRSLGLKESILAPTKITVKAEDYKNFENK